MMKWTKCAVQFLRISRPGVRVPSIAPKTSTHCVLVFLFVRGRGLEQGGGIYAASKATVQQRRPQPAAETGRSCWGRVLIFQSPAKGAAEKSANATRKALTARFRRGSQPVGMSIGRLPLK